MSAELAASIRAAADVLEQAPEAAKAVYRDVDNRTMDEVVAALRVDAAAAEAESST